MMSFFHVLQDASVVLLLSALAVILLTGLIGIIDDLLGGCSKSNSVITPPKGCANGSRRFCPPWLRSLLLQCERDTHHS